MMMRPPSTSDSRAASVTTYSVANVVGKSAVEGASNGMSVIPEHDIIMALERRLFDCQAEWAERFGKTAERLQESTREAKRALSDLETERERAARLTTEIEELKLEVETAKVNSTNREKYFQKELEDYRAKMKKKDLELSEVRESTSNDLSELGEKCRKLVTSLDEKQKLLQNVTDQLKTCRDDKNRVESLLDQEKNERGRAEKMCHDLEHRNEELTSQEQQLQQKMRQLEEDMQDCREECERRQKTIDELEDAVLAAKRAGAEFAMSSGERDRALNHALEENNKMQQRLEEAALKICKSNEKGRDLMQQLGEKEAQLRDFTREVETQREYCRTMKLDLERAQEQRETAYVEHENLAKQLIEFRALPICQQHLPSVSSNDFNSLKLVMPFIREKLEMYERIVHDLHQAKNEIAALIEQKKELLKTCKDKDAMINECRSSLEQGMTEIDRLRNNVLESDRKQEAATMRSARLTEQLHREQGDHEKTLQLLKATESEVNNSEVRFQKILYRMLQTLVGQRSGQQQSQAVIQQGLKLSQLVPMVQKEMSALHAASSRCFERYHELETELSSSRNLVKMKENEVRQLKTESEARLMELRQQMESERAASTQKFENLEHKSRTEIKALDTKLQEVSHDREELRGQMIRVDSTKQELETKLSQNLSALDMARNENRLLAAAGGVLLSALVNTLRRLTALIMSCAILRTQVAASEVFRSQLQNLLNSLAKTTGFTEKTAFSSTKPVGIFAFRKAVIAVLAGNRLLKFSNRNGRYPSQKQTLVVLPAGSCRQIGCTVGLDMVIPNQQQQHGACDALSFIYWLTGEDFSKRFLALGSILTLPESNSTAEDRIQSALRSSLRCVLTAGVECFDPQLCPSPNRPHAGSKRDSLLQLLATGLRQAFARHRSLARQQQRDDSTANFFHQNDLPVYSFQIIFDSICGYWQKLTDQLVTGWQQQRTRLQSDLADAQRQLAIYRPDVEGMRRQLEMCVPKAELETACSELASALDREKQLQSAVNDQARQLQRLMDENQSFVSQHSSSVATIASKNTELATLESRLSELIEANDRMQGVAVDAEQMVARAAADRRWACEYVKQVEGLAVRWAGKLSRLYTDQVEFRQFYGQLHGLGSTMPGAGSKNCEIVTVKGVPQTAFHASQACVRLTRTFLHLFDHARKYAQSIADAHSQADLGSQFCIDELSSVCASKTASYSSSNHKRSPKSPGRTQSLSRGSKSVGSTPRDPINANIVN